VKKWNDDRNDTQDRTGLDSPQSCKVVKKWGRRSDGDRLFIYSSTFLGGIGLEYGVSSPSARPAPGGGVAINTLGGRSPPVLVS
jgi:hypothetical protein